MAEEMAEEMGTGTICNGHWTVTLDRDNPPTKEDVEYYIEKHGKRLIAPLEEILGSIYAPCQS